MTVDLDAFRREVRDWVRANLEPAPRPGRRRYGPEDTTPEDIAVARALQRTLFDAGFAGISYPAEYGGRGLTAAHERVFREETVDYRTPDFGGVGHVTFGAIGRSLLAHGDPDLLARHIPRILAGEELWCQFYSEPAAGSDLAGIRTRAVRDGERWILNGAKIWSTGAHLADYAMCLARTNWDVSKHRGLTWFVVPTDAAGLTIRPILQISGVTGFCEEFLDDVVVEEVIGGVDDGWTVAQTMLVYERGAGDSSGLPAEPRTLAPDLVEVARRAGRLHDPLVRQMIARAHTDDYAQYHLGRRIAARLRAGTTPQPAIAAYGKLAAGTFAPRRVRTALEIAGPGALQWHADDPNGAETATDYLNGRLSAIPAGTNEVQRNGIGERVLGLPREPSFDSTKPFSEVLRDAENWNHRIG
ncbi:acyl-CoA dehydrogenase family protein [Nocardia bovistercoris]|uniref:Acyl-CoA dehydrogenase family protein n=1 Tax=Nocardia bovistercoris TaxID=2785916 RepID=A0A931IC91_9NOCA|nr:acyl-CoA dehydrogenase family protein [Nocardia bovistercoris]MBH0778436.1 acyl-CoA dehydrogenase family protein [Nocardia bovistercoris]